MGIWVGISLDGSRVANDLHRRYLDGRSSHDQVLRVVADSIKVAYDGAPAKVGQCEAA